MHSFIWNSANITVDKLQDLVTSMRENATLQNYVKQSSDFGLTTIQVLFFLLPLACSAVLVVLCIPLLCISRCTPTRKYARVQRKVDKKATQYLKQRD